MEPPTVTKCIRSDEQLIDQFLTGEKAESETAFESWSSGTDRWCSGCAGASFVETRTPKTPFRQPSSCWRKAGTIHNREVLGCWLREVAYRIALRARKRHARSTPQIVDSGGGRISLGPEQA